MPFSEIGLYNFRNIKNQKLPVHNEQVFFVGSNGQGKTNLLEAIYFVSCGRSFREHHDENIICFGQKEMSVQAKWISSTDTPTKLQVQYVQKKKTITINNTILKDRKQLVEQVPIIVFGHDDIQFVQGTAELRRWFFNQCLSRYFLGFIDLLQNYRKILKNRNIILKEGKYTMLDVYNEQLSNYGFDITQARRNFIEEFNKLFIPLFEEINNFGQTVKIEYCPSWGEATKNDIIGNLKKKEQYDMRIQTTSTGPHRDKFLFKVKGRNYLHEASTGQLRLLSIILRIVQAQLYSNTIKQYPVLLLDDVLLEVDVQKREKIMEKIPKYDQIFFTFLPNEDINKYRKSNALVYSVEQGEYTRIL